MDCSLCGGGASCVLELTTDNYPGETSWDIKDSSGDEKYNGSGYSDANTLYTLNMCLETDEYTFYITDTYGDGICCSYGSGGYKIKVDGEEVVSGGEFGSTKTEEFSVTSSPVAPPTTAPVTPPPTPLPTTIPPTTAPVTPPPTPLPTTIPPATAPVTPPTTAPVTPPADCKKFYLILDTDSYGDETSFTLTDKDGKTRLMGGGYASSHEFHETTCLVDGLYKFTISDSWGDGICCGEQGNGSYKIMLEDEMLKEGGDFGFSQETTFFVGSSFPTTAPTTAPTCLASGLSCIDGSECCSARCKSYVCEDGLAPPTSAPIVPPTTSSPPPTPLPTPLPTTAPPTTAPVTPPTSSYGYSYGNSPISSFCYSYGPTPTDAPVVPPSEAPVVPPSEAPVVSTFFPSKSLIDSSSFPTNAPFTPPSEAPVVSTFFPSSSP